jgi:hypothetical protein
MTSKVSSASIGKAGGIAKTILNAAFLLSLGVVAIPPKADAFLFDFSSSDGRSASVQFTVDASSNLIVTLTNTSTFDVLNPTGVLTAVFFDLAENPSLTRTSAVIGSGSVVVDGLTDAGGVVGGEWGYNSGLSGAPRGAQQGISAAGLGLFGPGDRFPGSNLAPPKNGSLAGVEYGLTSAGDIESTGNLDGTPLIKNSVVFTLSGLPSGILESDISNVSFQYGSTLVPEPGTLFILGSGLVGVAAFGRRLRKRG